jgi:hypothetical protein
MSPTPCPKGDREPSTASRTTRAHLRLPPGARASRLPRQSATEPRLIDYG